MASTIPVRLAAASRFALALAVVLVGIAGPSPAWAVTKTWDGGAGSSLWTAPNNWNPDGVPGPADDVIIDAPGPLTVMFPSGTSSIKSFVLANGLTISGGSLAVTAASSVSATGVLRIANGTLGGPGAIEVVGTLQFNGGTLGGPGVVTILPSGTLTMAGDVRSLQTELRNQGSGSWTQGQWNFSNGRFVNESTFIIDNMSILQAFGDAPAGAINSFENLGTTIKAGVGPVSFNSSGSAVPFGNEGLVEVTAGELALFAGGVSIGGDVTIAAGLQLNLAGTHTFDAASTVSGPGALRVAGATTTFAGELGPTTSIVVPFGTLTMEADATTSGFLAMADSGTLNGAGELVFGGNSFWNGGTMAGAGTTTIAAGGTLSMVGSTMVLARTLVNAGTATWTAGQFKLSNGVIINEGTFLANTSTSLSAVGAPPLDAVNAFQNNGLFTKQGVGSVSFSVDSTQVPFTNAGTVDVRNGILTFAGGFPNFDGDALIGGKFIVAGTFQWPGAAVATLAADLTLDGPASVVRNSASMLSALAPLATIAPIGRFALLNDRNFTTGGSLVNQGIVSMDDLCVLSADGACTQAAGGTFETIFGADGLGELVYGRMLVSGTATLSGLVRAIQSDGFIPANCDHFDIVEAASIVGTFTSQDLPSAGAFPIWSVDYTTIGSPQLATLTFVDVDINGDRSVDGADLGILLGAWDAAGVPSDLNCDGIVNGGDLEILLSVFAGRGLGDASHHAHPGSEASTVSEAANLGELGHAFL